MTPKVPAGADLKRSETGVSEKNLRCISGTSAFRISRYQHYWRRKTTFLSLLRTFLVVERNPLLKNCGFPPSCESPLFPTTLGADGRLRKQEKDAAVGLPQRVFLRLFAVLRQITATHTGYFPQARHTRAAQLVSLEFADSTYGLGVRYNLSSQALSIITR